MMSIPLFALASRSSRAHCLSGIYRDPNKISTTLKPETLLSSPLGHHLHSTTEPLRNNDRLSSYL
jgi:hypothetical protein